MSDLRPRAFDLETSGLEPTSAITVAGIASDVGTWLCLNTGGREATAEDLKAELDAKSNTSVRIVVRDTEAGLLSALSDFAETRLDDSRHYLTAYHGEVWKGGFDLPRLRSACVQRNVDWPFPNLAYADVMTMVDRFDTGDASDLDGVYEALIGSDHCDPFADSGAAVDAFEDGEWVDLLLHNLADVERTRELAVLAGRYVPKSDFRMKNLSPPDV